MFSMWFKYKNDHKSKKIKKNRHVTGNIMSDM